MAVGNYAAFYGSKDGDRKYNATSFERWLRPFFTTGVFEGGLNVTANNDMSVTLQPGYVFINGKVKQFENPVTFDLETPSGTMNRIDAIFLRRNDTDRDIQAIYMKGNNASAPVPPTVVREGAFYDLAVAYIYVERGALRITQAEVTDKRMDRAVCGYVVATVKEIDFTQIAAQFDQFFENYKGSVSDRYIEFKQQIDQYNKDAEDAYKLLTEAFARDTAEYKEKIDAWIEKQQGDVAEWEKQVEAEFSEWRKNQESTFNNWYVNNTEDWREQFEAWFEEIKGQLSGDPAGALQLQIDELRNALLTSQVEIAMIGSDEEFIIGSDGNKIAGFWTIRTSDTCACK